jgi:predicted DNA-binding protein
MPKPKRTDETRDTAVLFVRHMPRHMLARLKAAAALNNQTLGDYVVELFEIHLEELERKGLLPKGK